MSDILIRGMEKPKGFTDVRIYADGRVISQSFSKFGEQIATAIPVPDHGRLIDADALIENCMKEDSFIAELLFRKVNNATTIIPASKEDQA